MLGHLATPSACSSTAPTRSGAAIRARCRAWNRTRGWRRPGSTSEAGRASRRPQGHPGLERRAVPPSPRLRTRSPRHRQRQRRQRSRPRLHDRRARTPPSRRFSRSATGSARNDQRSPCPRGAAEAAPSAECEAASSPRSHSSFVTRHSYFLSPLPLRPPREAGVDDPLQELLVGHAARARPTPRSPRRRRAAGSGWPRARRRGPPASSAQIDARVAAQVERAIDALAELLHLEPQVLVEVIRRPLMISCFFWYLSLHFTRSVAIGQRVLAASS